MSIVSDAIQRNETVATATSFGRFLDQHPSVIDGVARDIDAIEDGYTIPLPAQHAMTGEVLHKSNSQAADIVCCVLRDRAKWDQENTCDQFE